MLPKRRISDVAFWVLTAVSAKPNYGAGIRKRIEVDSGGLLQLTGAQIYETLDSLVKQKLVQSVGDRTAPNGNLRKHYLISAEGTSVLKDEALLKALAAKTAIVVGALAPGAIDRFQLSL